MNKKCLFTYNYGQEKMKLIEKLGYDLIIADEKGITYDDSMKEVEVLVCYNPFNTLDISRMANLKWIQLSSIGIDQIPVEAVKNQNIFITNNKGGYSIPMGEWVVLKVLELYKNSYHLYKNQLQKKWKMDTGLLELYGKTVGFIGTGSIAIESAKRLQGFGVNIIGINTRGTDVEYFHKCYSKDELDYMLSICDVVVVSIPYTKSTHHMINESRLQSMKDGACIINIARGSVIDESALLENLKSGKLRGAALDVFEKEPLEETNPLWELENVIITPHNSWISEMRNERRFDLIYKNMDRYIKDHELINQVNLSKGY